MHMTKERLIVRYFFTFLSEILELQYIDTTHDGIANHGSFIQSCMLKEHKSTIEYCETRTHGLGSSVTRRPEPNLASRSLSAALLPDPPTKPNFGSSLAAPAFASLF